MFLSSLSTSCRTVCSPPLVPLANKGTRVIVMRGSLMMRSRSRRSNGWIAAIKRASEFHFISLELTKLPKRLGGILITLSYTSEYANYFQFFFSSTVTFQPKSVNLVLVLLITHLVAFVSTPLCTA